MNILSQLPLLLSVVAILSFGQLLFKRAADNLPDLRGIKDLWAFATEPNLVAALVLYALGTVLWVIALKRAPLSAVHGVIALSFALTPVLAMVFLGERLNWANGVGISFIMLGVAVIVRFAPQAG